MPTHDWPHLTDGTHVLEEPVSKITYWGGEGVMPLGGEKEAWVRRRKGACMVDLLMTLLLSPSSSSWVW